MWVVMVQELLEAGDGLITRVRPVNILLLQLVPIAPVADRVNTKLEQYVVAVVVLIHKRVLLVQTVVRRIPVDPANTEPEQRVVAVVVVIHKRVRRVQTVGHRILARRVNI